MGCKSEFFSSLFIFQVVVEIKLLFVMVGCIVSNRICIIWFDRTMQIILKLMLESLKIKEINKWKGISFDVFANTTTTTSHAWFAKDQFKWKVEIVKEFFGKVRYMDRFILEQKKLDIFLYSVKSFAEFSNWNHFCCIYIC